MVSGWRLAFCTTVPRDSTAKTSSSSSADDHRPTSSRFPFFSSTPKLHNSSSRLRCRTASATAPVSQASSVSNSPKLTCKTSSSSDKNTPTTTTTLFHRSCPSSPTSASTFSLLKTTLRLSRPTTCGICLESVKAGRGTAIFTAECSHAFHFPCVADHLKKHCALLCPTCRAPWKQLPVLDNRSTSLTSDLHNSRPRELNTKRSNSKSSDLKIYNDDEPLMSPTAGGRFNPIPESDYENDDDETSSHTDDSFQGFFTAALTSSPVSRTVDVRLLPESAVISAGRGYETHAVVLEVKAPPSPAKSNAKPSSFRAPVDLVAVIDVSNTTSASNLQMMKRAMRVMISSLSSNDRLSIVAFSACSKRLLPLRRMTVDGRRTARRIIDVIASTGQGMSAGDAVRKAAKVLEDRRVKNSVATIIVLSNASDSSNKSYLNQNRQPITLQTTRFPHLNIPIHTFGFCESGGACNPMTTIDEAFAKSIGRLLCVPVQDLRLQFDSVRDSVEVRAVYTLNGRAKWLGSGTGLIKLGDFHAEESREVLIELRVPITNRGARLAVSVRSSYTDPSSQQLVLCRDQALPVPNPEPSTCQSIERLRCVFISARAVAESKRVAERSDFSGAHHLLSSARALLIQSKSASAGELLAGLEAELAELKRRRQQAKLQWEKAIGRASVADKEEALTPTSAWRTAERLARMRKSLNRVSDLHGFENARF
uniref:Uncharacterized protein n=1 Tax=Kalanchoe fedtschenkoi TaxID=63787 RepID=A0A7N0SYI7_KALFE